MKQSRDWPVVHPLDYDTVKEGEVELANIAIVIRGTTPEGRLVDLQLPVVNQNLPGGGITMFQQEHRPDDLRWDLRVPRPDSFFIEIRAQLLPSDEGWAYVICDRTEET